MSFPVIPSGEQVFDLTLARGYKKAADEKTKDIIGKLLLRLNSVQQEHEVFRQWCDRADNMYYPTTMDENNGVDVWPEHESAKVNGRQHVSGGVFTPYVDIPSSLQAVEPIENMLPVGVATNDDEANNAAQKAAAEERVYVAWKGEEDFDLKWHKAIVTKSLYGRTAARIYWDDINERPCFEVIQQPRHLYLGYKTADFDNLEWAAYRMYYEP